MCNSGLHSVNSVLTTQNADAFGGVTVGTVCYRLLNIFHTYPFMEALMTHRVIGLVLVNTYPTGYFDGSTPTNIRGVGIVLLISSSHLFHAEIGYVKITNTRV